MQTDTQFAAPQTAFGGPSDLPAPISDFAGVKSMMDLIREGMSTNANTRKTVKTALAPMMKWFPPDADKIRAQFAALVALGYTDITIGFWRVSDGQQATVDTYGPEVQIKQVTACAIATTARGVDMFIHDIESGTHESRTGIDLVREFVATGHVKRVIAYRYDRFARNVKLSEDLHAEFARKKCQIVSASEDLGTGPVAVLMRQVLAALGQFEAALISQRMSGGKKMAVQKKGIWAGGEVPYGYLAKGQRGDTGKGILVMCELEGKVIILIFRLYEMGFSQTAIANFLNDQRIPTRNGGKLGWRQGQIRRILKHEAAYRAEALFSNQCFAPDVIAHDAILPHRAEAGDRTYRFGNVTEKPRGAQVPADLFSEPLPIMPRANSVHSLTPNQARDLLRLFALRNQGMSQVAICATANELGIGTLEGRMWRQSNLQMYLSRRAMYEATIAAMGITLDEAPAAVIDQAARAEAVNAELVAVERIKALRAEGLSCQAIGHHLNAEGFRTARGGRWHSSTIARVINGHTRRTEAPH